MYGTYATHPAGTGAQYQFHPPYNGTYIGQPLEIPLRQSRLPREIKVQVVPREIVGTFRAPIPRLGAGYLSWSKRLQALASQSIPSFQ